MSEQRPWKKKRHDENELAVTNTVTKSLVSSTPPPLSFMNLSSNATLSSTSVSTRLTLLHQQQQIDNLTSELQHEQSARSLDAKKASQQLARLQQQVALASEEAAAAREALQETTTESERHVCQLTTARDQAVSLNRELQVQLQQAYDETANVAQLQTELERTQRKCLHWQDQVQAQQANEAAFQREIQTLKETVEQKLHATRRTQEPDPVLAKLFEEAPPAVLQELNKCRIQLADTERQCRQWQAKLEAATTRNHELVRTSEQWQHDAQRYPKVLAQLDELQTVHAQEHAELLAWHEFGTQVGTVLNTDSPTNATTRMEPASILRRVTKLQADWTMAWQSVTKYKAECDRLQREAMVGNVGAKMDSTDASRAAMEREWNVKLEVASQTVESARLEATLFQREAESLRQLIQTFEHQVGRGGGAAEVTIETTAPTLQIRLDRVTEQYQLARQEQTTLTEQLDASRTEQLASTAELERVRSKFHQLRDALTVEKEKVAAFEARVVQAEQLAGKGSFDPKQTRVWHLAETPLIQSLKEQVQELQSQLESVATSDKRNVSVSDAVTGMANPDKLNQRLKETFKEQIAIFREAVYLMTGFKVDMLTGMDRPTFRLRSVFAEQEEDQLLLQWPKAKVKDDATSLDILQTELAKVLTTTPSYDYMTKFHSLPAFLASVQLSLFEKQTVVLS